MEIMLVVVRPFAGHARGDTITETAEIKRVLTEREATDVVRVLTRKES